MLGAMWVAMSGIKPTGRHREKRLSAATVRTMKAPGLHGDGNGLYLKVDPSGAKRWIQRLVIDGKRRDIGLGSADSAGTPLLKAREKALENRKLARAGGDPLAAKRRSMEVLTFQAAAEKVHELSKPTWRNEKHGDQWINTLTTYAFPFFGSKRIDTVGSADVLAALSPIWNSRPETARRVKQRVGSVFKWAMANGWRSDNPAEAIDKALPKHDRSKVKHREALPYEKVGAAVATVRESEAGQATKLAFEFLVLTATRSAETREAVWGEFDLDNAIWTIPAARMKAKKAHRIPLSSRSLAILAEAKALKREEGDFVFPGTKDKKPLSDMTLSKLMRDLGIAAVPHGFRSSFRDWAGDTTNHPHQAVEFALAHVIKDKSEAAYVRSDLLERRRPLMDDWQNYISVA